MLSEDELIEECIKGNRVAQKLLYDTYSAVMFGICLRYMPTNAEAEDALITGFTTIFSKLDSYKKEGSFEGWMKRIMINNAISNLRNNKHFYCQEDINNMKIEAIAETPINKLNAQEIIRQIQLLPNGYRVIFNLIVIEGYSYEETAKMLRITIGTVRSQLHKARKELQKRLNYND